MEGGVLRTLQQLALLLPLLLVLLLLHTTTADAEAIQKEILTTWNGQPVEHVPVSIILDSSRDDQLQVVIDAPFYDDPAPPAPPGSSYIGLWDYEVVEVFFVNDVDQYLQIEITPQGQYFALLFDGVRNHKRFSLPLTVEAEITGGVSPSWTATVTVPTEYLPQGVSRFNAYSTHGASPNRVYEAYSPAPADAAGPDFHNLQYFAPLDLNPVISGITDRPMSNLWLDAIAGRISYSINTYWNGSSLPHSAVNITLGGSEDTLFVSVSAPFFDDPPPPAPAGEPFFGLWEYEVVEAFFLNNENQYFELEVGPYGQNLGLLLWTKNDTYNQLRHSLPLKSSATIDRVMGRWTATVEVPVDYLPPKLSRFNAYCKHLPGPRRHEESLYPQDSTDQAADFHALKYFQPIDMNSVIPDQSERPMSQLWQDTIQGIYRYEITTEWNSVPVTHDPVTLTLEGFEAGVELNVTAPFFNDPPPPGVAGQPLYGLWDYEVAEMFFLNDNDEYLEVELSPWGQHLLLMLKGERNTIKHSLALDYVVTERVNGTGSQPGRWHGSALIPPSYFPPNVTRMNAYAIHGTGDSRVYEALYPAPHNDPQYPQPDFHNLGLFQKIDFEFLVVDNSQYSDLWLEAIANSTATTPAPAAALKTSAEGTKIEISEVIPRVDAALNVEVTTVKDEEIQTTTVADDVRDDLETGFTDVPDVEISTVTTDETLTIPQKPDAVPTTVPQKPVAVPTTVPQKSDAVPAKVPQKQDAIGKIVPQKLDAVSTTVPQKTEAVPTTIPQRQDTVPTTVPQKQDAVLTTIPQRQDAVPKTVPQKQKVVPATVPQKQDPVPTAAPQKLVAVVPEIVTLEDSTDATTTTDSGTEELRHEGAEAEDVPTTTEPWSEEGVTVEVTTEVRELDVPQPELVKEARRQDIEKPPPENLFRPIPIRAPPKTPMPTKLENTTILESPTVDVLIPNPSFVGQPPLFAHQHLFPPSSFFNPQSTFGQPIPLTQDRPAARPQTTLVGGKPVAIQGLPRFPLPPQIKLKEHVPLTHAHLIPQQPHLDHLLDHHQKQQEQQQLPQPVAPHSISSSTAIQQLTEEQRHTQETNEILPLPPTSSNNEILDNEEASSIVSHSASQQNLETKVVLEKTHLLDHVVPALEQSLQEPPQPVPVSVLPIILPAQPIIQASPPRQAAPVKPPSPAIIPTPQQSSVSVSVPLSAIPFDNYPPPHDVCVAQGLHADPFRCPIFHECVLQNNEWQVYTWRCPRGKYFDDSSLTCIKGYC